MLVDNVYNILCLKCIEISFLSLAWRTFCFEVSKIEIMLCPQKWQLHPLFDVRNTKQFLWNKFDALFLFNEYSQPIYLLIKLPYKCKSSRKSAFWFLHIPCCRKRIGSANISSEILISHYCNSYTGVSYNTAILFIRFGEQKFWLRRKNWQRWYFSIQDNFPISNQNENIC